MESHSRKRLRPWLEQMVISGEYHGLEWVNENEKMFKIPWQRLGHPEWREEDNLIFKEWEKVTGRFKEGDELCWSDWKTRLRCALTKNPEIKEMHNLHSKDKCNPYKVYKFEDVLPAPTRTSEESRLPVCPEKPKYNNLGSGKRFASGIKNIFTGNIPTVVTDGEAMFENVPNEQAVQNSTDTMEEILFLAHTDYENCNSMHVQYEQEGQFPMLSILTPHKKNQDNLSLNIKPELYQEPGCHIEPSSVNLPSDLESIETDDLLVRTEVDMMSTGEGFSIPRTSLEAAAAKAWSSHGALRVKIFYLKDKIVDTVVGADGCRVFYNTSREILCNTTVQEDVFGPESVQEIELPGVSSHVGKEKKKLINDLLERMDRGIVLQVVDGDIYAKRLCGTRVFVSNGSSTSEVLDRKNKAPVKIFDFNEQFKSALHASAVSKDYKYLQPHVYLTFGQEIKIGQPNPMDRILVYMQIIHIRAAELVSDLPEIREDTQELQISSLDSMDRILQAFTAMSIKK